jgi:hypothetical protein
MNVVFLHNDCNETFVSIFLPFWYVRKLLFAVQRKPAYKSISNEYISFLMYLITG